MQTKICLIIPCYNEEKRLDFKSFVKHNPLISFIFVNDGSTDKTLSLLEENVVCPNYVLNIDQNVGKAEAIRQGIQYLQSFSHFQTMEWIGYWDADLSTPVQEVDNFIKFTQFYKHVDAVCGSRLYRLGSHIERNYLRHILGRIFATAVEILFKIGSYDSQCGAKLFKKNIIDVVFKEPFISQWLFDVEILLRLKNYRVIEYPIKVWCDVKGSKLKILKVARKVIFDFIRIYMRYMKN